MKRDKADGQTGPEPQPGILDISPYVPGKSQLPGEGPVIKLSSNESPLGASPYAIAACREASEDLARYPDGSALELRRAIADETGLDAARIVCGTGSDELLNLLASAYLGVGDEAIYTRHGFLVYPISIKANGALPVIAEETGLTADVDAILAKVSVRTKMVFLANPNNPTGTYMPRKEVERLRAGLPGHVVLVLDGAYCEYVEEKDYDAGIDLVTNGENTVMTRTFSKIHGLASLRIGWAYCPPAICDVLHRIRAPFNLSNMAIKAGAAAIKDRPFVDEVRAHTKIWRAWVHRECEELGLEVTPGVANFVLVHFPNEDGRRAVDADLFLQQRRIVLRRVDANHLPLALRLTIGSEHECRTVLEALSKFMSSAPKEGGRHD